MSARRIVIEFLGDDRSLGRTINSVEGRTSRIGSAMRKVGAAAVIGFGVAAAAAVKFGKDSIDAASDLNESINAVNVTYGRNADAVLDLSRKAATALGLPQNEFNALSVRFSAFAKTVAGSGGDVVGTLDDLTTRAADFASVMNLDVAEAATLFQSGLAGETEPLRKFGIDMSAATVQAHAYEVGIAKVGEELTEQQKVQARYSVLMKQTAQTHGDFANTSDQLANQQRILKAQFANLQAEVGAKLLPIMAKLVSWVATTGLPAFSKFANTLATNVGPALALTRDIAVTVFGFLSDHKSTVVALTVALAALVVVTKAHAAAMAIQAAGGLVGFIKQLPLVIRLTRVWTAVQWALNVAMRANPIGIVITALAALGVALAIAWKKSATFRGIVTGAFNAVRQAVSTAMAAIRAVVNAGMNAVRTIFKVTTSILRGDWSALWSMMRAAASAAWGAIRGLVRAGADAVIGAIRSIPDRLRGFAGLFLGAGRALIQAFVDGMRNAAGIISGIAGNVWSAIKGLLNSAIAKINSALSFTIPLPGPNLHVNVSIPFLARGVRNFAGGLAVVGEEGPELVGLPRGSNVFSNRESAAMLGAGTTAVVVLNLDGREVWRALLRQRRLNGKGLGLA